MKKKFLIFALLFVTGGLLFAQDLGITCTKVSEIEITPGLTIREWSCDNGCTQTTIAYLNETIFFTPEECPPVSTIN
jgi:hypothetical protein